MSKLIEVPAGILMWFKHNDNDWDYETKKKATNAGRGVYLCRGKVLGGSSCTNVLLYHHGAESDYQ